jgi:hypothetical protein
VLLSELAAVLPAESIDRFEFSPLFRQQCHGETTSYINNFRCVHCSIYSVVDIATGYGLDDRDRSSSPGRVKNFLLSTSSTPALGSTQPPIQWVPGALSQGGKAVGA